MAKEAVLTLFEDLKTIVFRVSDKTPAENNQFIFSLMAVGLPINHKDFKDPWVPTAVGGTSVEETAARQTALQNLSQLVNNKLAMDGTGRVMVGGGSISETWSSIIESAESSIDRPPPDLAKEQRYKEARKLLWRPNPQDPEVEEPTGLNKAYQRYKQELTNAEIAYAAAYTVAKRNSDTLASWPVEGLAFYDKVEAARSNLITAGRKDEYEAAEATIGSQGSDAVETIIASAKKNFDPWQILLAGQIAAKIPYIQVFPSNWSDPTPTQGWTQYKFTEKAIRQHHDATTTSWGASTGVSWGFWSIGGGAGSTKTEINDSLSDNGIEIDITFAPAQITRPWLKSILLSVDGWDMKNQDAGVISEGTATQLGKASKAFWLPALPTQMLLVKSIKLRTTDTQKTYNYMHEHVSGGGRIGWGFFSIGGSYERDTVVENQSFHLEDGWIIVDGVQLVGWVSEIMPFSPPRSGLPKN